MNNTFASQHQASFFKKIRLKQRIGDRPLPIQKIISVPMLVDDEVKGVIQNSRKGADESDPLADFTDMAAARWSELVAVNGRAL